MSFVVQCAEDAKTNCAYMSMDMRAEFTGDGPHYVRISKYIYRVAFDPRFSRDQIGLNVVQRNDLSLTIGDRVAVDYKPIIEDGEKTLPHYICCTVQHLKPGMPPVNVDLADLQQKIRSHLTGEILQVGQRFLLPFGAAVYVLTVCSIGETTIYNHERFSN